MARPDTLPTAEQVKELEKKAMHLRAYNIISIFAAKSGHSGGTLSIADISAAIYFSEARLDPKNPEWPLRDRIYYSAGHKAPAQYAALAMSGFFPIETAMTLRKLDSPCQGHPHSLKCKGVEISSGSLGQGLGIAVGTALGLRLSGSDSRVYCLMGDGEQQEGSIWEAAMSASHHKLDNLVGFVDLNGLQIDGDVCNVMNIAPLHEKYKAFGWNVITCDGHNMKELLEALLAARKVKGKPTVIIGKTVKGKGVSYMEGIAGWHGNAPKNREQLDQALNDIMGKDVFPKEMVDGLLKGASDFGVRKIEAMHKTFPAVKGQWWNEAADMKVEMKPTRHGFGQCLNKIGDDPRLVTIQVDISGSICINEFEKGHPERQNRVFSLGIAEQNMLQVAAGLAKTGLIPIAGNYGVFACGRCWDQLRTSICYPNMNVKIAGAHAGVSIGADGATHQALEEISLVSVLPNMTMFVPSDYLETERLTKMGVLQIVGPVYIRFTREPTPMITKAETPCEVGKANVIRFRGRKAKFADAFETVLAENYKNEKEDLAIFAVGPMVAEAMRAAVILKENYGKETRVINMHTVKPLDEAAVAAAVTEVGKIVTAEEHQVGGFGNIIAGAAARAKAPAQQFKMAQVGVEDRFGESGECWDLLKNFGLTAEFIVQKSLKLLQ